MYPIILEKPIRVSVLHQRADFKWINEWNQFCSLHYLSQMLPEECHFKSLSRVVHLISNGCCSHSEHLKTTKKSLVQYDEWLVLPLVKYLHEHINNFIRKLHLMFPIQKSFPKHWFYCYIQICENHQ